MFPRYTHTDRSGMNWRFAGSRPISALADSVMAECGFEPSKDGAGWKPKKVRRKPHKTRSK